MHDKAIPALHRLHRNYGDVHKAGNGLEYDWHDVADGQICLVKQAVQLAVYGAKNDVLNPVWRHIRNNRGDLPKGDWPPGKRMYPQETGQEQG